LELDCFESDSFTEDIVDVPNQMSIISLDVNQDAFGRSQEDIEDRDLEPDSMPSQGDAKEEIYG